MNRVEGFEGAGRQAATDQLAIATLIARHAADAIFLLDQEGRTTFANPAAERMFGWSQEELLGTILHDVVHYKRPDGTPFPMTECPLGNVFSTGETLTLHEEVFFHRNGTPIPVTCSNGAYERDGEVAGGVMIVRDETERKRAEKQNELLLLELNHRVKNNIAVIQSIAQQSFKSGDLAKGLAAFEGRLLALAAAHSLLTDSDWRETSLRGVVTTALRPFNEGDRIRLDGPEVSLNPSAALALSLAFHELATNASKYGSLSREQGHVDVTWVLSDVDEPKLSLSWREHGGPPVNKPTGNGFGSRMIKKGLASELSGAVTMTFAPDGLLVEIEAPLGPLKD